MVSFTLLEALAAAFAAAVAWRLWGRRLLLVVTVIDGDTYMAVNQEGRRFKLRLKGCDCPELDQPGGEAARERVKELLLRHWLKMRLHGRDRYERELVSVRLDDGRDLCQVLLAEGLAFSCDGFSLGSLLARLRGKGVWGSSKVQRPWQSRSRSGGFLGRLFRRPSQKSKQSRTDR